MPNRLEPINLIDFTGGLNLRRNQFQLNSNESPEMRNIAIDPLGGIYTRLGWSRWSKDIVTPETVWDPRRAYLSQLSDGTDVIYIAANNKVYTSNFDTTFTALGLVADAAPHKADFASYGDNTYIACGREQQMARRRGVTFPVTKLTYAGSGSWNDDYLNPVEAVGPSAEVVETHSGYLFAANLQEDGVTLPNRLRWSHPTSPEDWAQADFIDIETGGSEITGLQTYQDHLLIFKPDSMWALYGYDADSWQLVQKSSTIGAFSPQVVTRNENAVFFYSRSDRGSIYAYTGENPVEIGEPLRYAMENLIAPELVWVGWIGRKLWVTVPWNFDDGPTDDNLAVFVYDPTVGDKGAWTYYSSRTGNLGPIVSGSNTDSQLRPLGVLCNNETPCVVRLEAHDYAADTVYEVAVWGYTNPDLPEPDNSGYLMTGNGEEIVMGGAPGDEPFETVYRTPWVTADWPTRKKSFRRPDIVCRLTGFEHDLRIRSYRDYEELNPKRMHTLTVPSGAPGVIDPSAPPGQVAAVWNRFRWNDGTRWNQTGSGPPPIGGPNSNKQGAAIRRGSSFGLCKALQLQIQGLTPSARWGIDALILKIVMRRFR